ncbi:phage regulatory CII family protein [Xanthomonas translucens pv. translucens]|uniref:phage regulatory CII family protein n=1 Tax=Xanthomonas campestris pv. translucens TaxID=343 RepID=UPI003F72C6DA
MNIIDAAHHTVHSYPGGSEALATRLVTKTEEGAEKTMSAAVLRNKVNPANTTHHLTLAEAAQIMGVTGNVAILHALAAQLGYVIQKMDAAPAADSVLSAMLSNSAAHGEFFQCLQHALSDGLITENEMGDLAKSGVGAIESMVLLLSLLRKVTGQRGVTA